METTLVVCPHCHAQNRIPKDKRGAPATCGRCHRPLPGTDSPQGRQETITLRCSQCRAKNRVPIAKLHAGAKCGKCAAPLQHEDVLAGRPLVADEASFDTLVMRSPLPVLLYGWAPWCGVCTKTSPMVNELAAETKGKVRVVKLNVDTSPGLADRYHILGVPAFFIFEGGDIKHHFPGAVPKQELLLKMAPFIS